MNYIFLKLCNGHTVIDAQGYAPVEVAMRLQPNQHQHNRDSEVPPTANRRAPRRRRKRVPHGQDSPVTLQVKESGD